MSSYPPGGDYDERLLDSAPKATKLEKQEGYNVNLLASDDSETPMNTRPAPATVDGHASPEAGEPSSKEGYASSYSAPWYRQGKWRIIMLIGAIIIIGAIVGGAVGGTLASKNNKNNTVHSGPTTTLTSLPTTTTDDAQAGASTSVGGVLPPASSLPPNQNTSGAGALPTGNSVVGNPTPTHTPTVNSNNMNGLADSDPGSAPVGSRFD